MPEQDKPDFLDPLSKVAGKADAMKKKLPKALAASTNPDRKITIRDLFTKALKGLSYDAKMQVLANIRAEIPANKAPSAGTMDPDKIGTDFMKIAKNKGLTADRQAAAAAAREKPELPEIPDDELKRLAKGDKSDEEEEWSPERKAAQARIDKVLGLRR
jgi:hypothetical protein